jgi:hypothetical protein
MIRRHLDVFDNVLIGRTVTPLAVSGTRKMLMPFCGFGVFSVRASMCIQFASSASVAQIFCPLMTQ